MEKEWREQRFVAWFYGVWKHLAQKKSDHKTREKRLGQEMWGTEEILAMDYFRQKPAEIPDAKKRLNKLVKAAKHSGEFGKLRKTGMELVACNGSFLREVLRGNEQEEDVRRVWGHSHGI